MTFWIIAHTLIWRGEAARNEDLPFPFNVLAVVIGGEGPTDRNAKIDEGAEAVANADEAYDKIYFEETDEPSEKLSLSSIYDISINGLYNFLVTPKTAAGNLYLSLGFVSSS